jgi:hypothetical protein
MDAHNKVGIGCSQFFFGFIGLACYVSTRFALWEADSNCVTREPVAYARTLVVCRRDRSTFGRQPGHDLQMDRTEENARAQGWQAVEIPGI